MLKFSTSFLLLSLLIYNEAYAKIEAKPQWVKLTRQSHSFSLRPHEPSGALASTGQQLSYKEGE